MSFIINASGLREIGPKYQAASRLVTTELVTSMRRVTFRVEGKAKQRVRRDTSTLARSLTSEVRGGTSEVRGLVGSNLPYAKVVEEGRRAGAPMPPQGALLGWMRRKGIDAEAEFVVRRGIARRGIPARPYLRPAFRETIPEANREFAQIPRRVLAQLGSG